MDLEAMNGLTEMNRGGRSGEEVDFCRGLDWTGAGELEWTVIAIAGAKAGGNRCSDMAIRRLDS